MAFRYRYLVCDLGEIGFHKVDYGRRGRHLELTGKLPQGQVREREIQSSVGKREKNSMWELKRSRPDVRKKLVVWSKREFEIF